MTLEEARDNIGRLVVYQSHPGDRGDAGAITRVTDQWVFVDYVGSGPPKATPAEKLTLLTDLMSD